MTRPVVGITVDNRDNTAQSGAYECAIAYSRAVRSAGGVSVLLPHEVERVDDYLQLCDGLLLTGGVDPRTEPFGEPTHRQARPMDRRRQTFETALLDGARQLDRATLGVCLGMQLMALHAGGHLNQYLPDTLEQSQVHEKNNRHSLVAAADNAGFDRASANAATVVSSHRQAIDEPGALRVVATAPDGVIEAVDDPARPFYLGVQWHPERGGDGPLNQGLIDRFVAACRK